MTTLQVGGHGDQVDPIAEAAARGATLAQFFLGDPQAWKGPEIRYAGGATALKAAAEEAAARVEPPTTGFASQAGNSCSNMWTLPPRSAQPR